MTMLRCATSCGSPGPDLVVAAAAAKAGFGTVMAPGLSAIAAVTA